MLYGDSGVVRVAAGGGVGDIGLKLSVGGVMKLGPGPSSPDPADVEGVNTSDLVVGSEMRSRLH